MPVFALWSAPRARSTAFFRSMVERGDMVGVHEPFSDLAGLGETDVEGRTFDSPVSLLAWLVDQTHDVNVFLKDTTGRRHHAVLADRRLLAEARHAFLIRRPEEIAASSYAVEPDMGIDAIGLEALHELHAAVREAGGHRPVVIDSDVVGPVASGGMHPVDGGVDGDAEHLGEHDGGDLGGELQLRSTPCRSRVDPEYTESLTESIGGDGPTWQVTGEQPATRGGRADPDVVSAAGAR